VASRVLIVGGHPHRGKTGTLTGELLKPKDGGPEMARVELDEEVAGVDACYAEAKDLQPVASDYRSEVDR
jgi:hypothetical protein